MQEQIFTSVDVKTSLELCLINGVVQNVRDGDSTSIFFIVHCLFLHQLLSYGVCIFFCCCPIS